MQDQTEHSFKKECPCILCVQELKIQNQLAYPVAPEGPGMIEGCEHDDDGGREDVEVCNDPPDMDDVFDAYGLLGDTLVEAWNSSWNWVWI